MALRAEAETYRVKATTGQQDQVKQLVLATLGSKPLPKADFEKKVAELIGKSITFALTTGQSTAMKRDTRVSVATATIVMSAVLDATKLLGAARVKDGLYSLDPQATLAWVSYLDNMPCFDVSYTPAK